MSADAGETMKTDLQKRTEQIDDIVLLANISDEEYLSLRQQLDSLSNLGINVVHVIVTKIVTKEEQQLSFERNR
jgi:predicted metal-binding transcription factor (methanogenesis marker protein 9)